MRTNGDVLQVVTSEEACRNNGQVKNRQPVAKLFVKADFALPESYRNNRDELNVKIRRVYKRHRAFHLISAEPQLRTVGAKYVKHLNDIRKQLSEIDGNKAMKELDENGVLTLDLGDIKAELTKDDLLISQISTPGFASVSDYGVTVVIDTRLTEELITEGFVREVTSKIQTMRKDSGFEVMDNIRIYVNGNKRIEDIVRANSAEISKVTLAREIVYGSDGENKKEWNLNGENVTLTSKNFNKKMRTDFYRPCEFFYSK